MAMVADNIFAQESNHAWQDTSFAVSVSLEIPTAGNKLQQFCRDPEQYFIKSMKRRNVEVSERRMSPEEKESLVEPNKLKFGNSSRRRP